MLWSKIKFSTFYEGIKYALLQNAIKSYKYGSEPLLTVCNSLKPNIDPSKTKNPESDFCYIELSNINSSLGTIDGYTLSLGSSLPSRAKRQVSTGDIVASAVVGSIDKTAIISDDQNDYIASTGFFHLRPTSVASEYLLMLVRSQCVQMQFQQESTGGILSAVSDSRLKHVKIPKLPQAIQDHIVILIKGAHLKKKESIKLLNQAKSRVEQLIEEAVQP